MFFKKSSLGRAALLAVLVLFVSVGVTSCQKPTETPGENLPNGVYHLLASDPICGKWDASWGLLMNCTSDFVWATCCSGEKQEKPDGADYTVTGYTGNEYYKKGTSSIYVAYNEKNGTVNKNEGVILFIAKASPYRTPEVGKWYGVKFQIDENNPAKALIEGAAGSDYNNISSLSEAVTKFAYGNTDCFNPSNFNESASGATKN